MEKFKIVKKGFRKDLNDYFETHALRNKQISPFIVVNKTVIVMEKTVKALLDYPDETSVFHTWVGKWRSDVFLFTILDLKNWLEENKMPIKIEEFEEKKIKILIVDDDISVQTYLKKLLGGIFIDIEVASDGFQAGMKLIQFKPDLILLDLFMPNMDGFEVCKTVKGNPSTHKTKILIMTGHGTKENYTKAISLGADAFLSKPSSKKEIISCIEKLLKPK